MKRGEAHVVDTGRTLVLILLILCERLSADSH